MAEITYKGFPLSTIFTSQNGDTDLKQIHINGLGISVVSSGEQNQGIIGKTDKTAKIIKENTITVDMFGNVFFRDFEYKMVTHARVFSLECIDEVSNEAQLYLVSRLKYLKSVYSYQNMCSWNKIKDDEIFLPTSDEINPDYDYMERYIKKLELERVAELEIEQKTELENYLTVVGLDDYELTDDDKETLNKEIQYKNFCVTKKMSDIFLIESTKSLDAGKLTFINEGINFVGRSYENNGIQGKIAKQSFEPNNANTITATVIGNYKYVKLQKEPYYCSQNINKLTPYENISDRTLYYLICFIQKFVSQWDGQQGGYKLQEMKDFEINLPTSDGINPDYEHMERYIKVQEKLAIKDVVLSKERIIEITKKIVSE